MAVSAKICGLTSPEDAALAVRHGAAWLGVIRAGGPRHVEFAVIREIVAAAGGVPVLAVVRPDAAEVLRELVAATGVTGLQLHGRAPDALAADLAAAGLVLWRSVALDDGAAIEQEVQSQVAHADVVLVEPRRAGRSGGLGLRLDRDAAIRARRVIPQGRMALAGGLDPNTVAEAIRRVGPDLVDVSSGVESAPGRKDPSRLARFLEAVRNARSPD